MNRVLLVVWGFDRFGGMERHVTELAMGLRRVGVEVLVFSETPVRRSNLYARQLRAATIPLFAAPWLVWIANGLHLATRWPRSRRDGLIHGGGLLSRSLVRALQRVSRGSDVVHIHGCRLGQTWLLDWARARGMASVYTEHVAIADNGGPLTPAGPRQVLSAGVIACVSEHSSLSLAAVLPEPRPIAVTGHNVSSLTASCRHAAAPDRFEILCPARLETYKGVDVLLRAFAVVVARHPEAHLTIAGDGRLRSELRKLARRLGIQGSVNFAGTLPPSRMAAALCAADAVVLPSRSEGLPLALLEAMALGKPVVATRAGGMPEMIRCLENGLLVPIGEPSAMAEALGALARDPELRMRLGAAARQTFERGRHREARVIPQMLDIYRRAEMAR